MARSKYPLDALVRLRDEAADKATRRLAEALRDRDLAAARSLEAQRNRELHEDGARAVRMGEQAKLARGELTVADLLRADAWAASAEAEAAELRAKEAGAAHREQMAEGEVTRLRDELARCVADVGVVEKDRQAFVERANRAQEARDDEVAAEAPRPGRP